MLNNLTNMRNKYRITQKELANKIGIALRTYQYWESGKCEPSTTNAIRLAQILGTTVEEIFLLTNYNKEG